MGLPRDSKRTEMAAQNGEALRPAKIPGAVKVRVISWDVCQHIKMWLEDLCEDLEATELIKARCIQNIGILMYVPCYRYRKKNPWSLEERQVVENYHLNACELDNLITLVLRLRGGAVLCFHADGMLGMVVLAPHVTVAHGKSEWNCLIIQLLGVWT